MDGERWLVVVFVDRILCEMLDGTCEGCGVEVGLDKGCVFFFLFNIYLGLL